MKSLFIITSLIFLASCSSAPKPTEPKGEWYQINSSHYYQLDKSNTTQKGVK